MSERGFALPRGRAFCNKKMSVGSCPMPVHRKDTSTELSKELAIDASTQLVPGRPRVFLAIAIDGLLVGRIKCELFSDIVPRTAENFRALCTGEKGMGTRGKPLHFKGCPFHRIVPNIGVQTGDMVRGTGKGGDSIYGPFFEDESFDLLHSDAGLLSMMNEGTPNSNSSKFCIMTGPVPSLDKKSVVFGRVLGGMDVVRRVESSCTTFEGCVDNTSSKAVKDEFVSFRPVRSAAIVDCGQLCDESVAQPGSLAIEDDAGQPLAKRQRTESLPSQVHVFHILKKHKDSRRPETWQGKKVTCTKGKAKLALETIRKRLEAAALVQPVFVELAREMSDDTSAQCGGDLGTVVRGQGTVDDEIEDAIFALEKGQLSEILETVNGVHLLLRTE